MNRNNEYTWEELADMHLAFGAAGGNSALARRMYQERYPNRRLPNRRTFVNVDQRLRETGSLQSRMYDTGRNRSVRTPQFEEEVLERFEDNPSTSTRIVAHELRVNSRLVWNVVHDNGLHPFHRQKVQALGPNDFPARLAFVNWFLQQRALQPEFPALVLFTDEASFSREGIVNTHNNHVWAEDNPHATFIHGHQERFTVNLWAGILNDFLIGPYLMPPRLNGHNYLVFLQQVLPELMEDVPLAIRRVMWFQHDGAPAHFTAEVRNHLTQTFDNRWIGRGGPVTWPARSPDLTPLDFFFWGAMKSIIYSEQVESEEDLVARIVEASETIRHMPEIFQRTQQSLLRRCNLCRNVGGRNFEHLL